jgi:hypothetical protein
LVPDTQKLSKNEPSSLRLLLSHAGITVAVGLGVIYVVGALLLIGQLSEEQVSMLDALPLVPIEQILARGIGVSAQICLLLGFVSIAFPAVGYFLDRMLPKEPALLRTDPLGRHLLRLTVLSLGLLVLFTPPRMILPLAVACLGGVAAIVGMRRSDYGIAVARLVGCVVFVLGFSLTIILTVPVRLPEASLTLVESAPDRVVRDGALISRTDSTWYLATSDESITAVSSAFVVEGEITQSENSYGQTLAALLLDDFRR